MIYFLVALASLLLTLFLVFPVRWLAFRCNAVANPGGRSIHTKPTALWGGLAIYTALLIIGSVVYFGFPQSAITASLIASKKRLLGLLFGSTFLLFVGLIDDYKPMRARTKLLGQVLAASICVVFGFTIPAIHIPFWGALQLGEFGTIIFVFWVLAITNAINLIDGLDGLASTVGLFACIGNGIIALISGHIFVAFFSFAMAGCLIGFLFHNFPPAKIFLGDTGSMLIGFLLAVTVLESNLQKRSTTIVVLAPLVLLGFSLLDVALSIIRRFLRGKPIFSSDLGHIHHRLMSKFDNPRRVLFIVGCFSMMMMCVSITIVQRNRLPEWVISTVFAVAFVGVFFFVRLLGLFRMDRLRYILNNREEVKFFVSLLSFQRTTLPKITTKKEWVSELDWTCQALKPHRVLFLQSSGEVLYCYASPHIERVDEYVYQDTFESDTISIKWTCSTMNDDPTMCDVRLLWRELFLLYKDEYERIQQASVDAESSSASKNKTTEPFVDAHPTPLPAHLLSSKGTASANS